MLARVLSDHTSKYDTLERGWKGEIWIQVQAGSFPVLLHPGIPLVQFRFFDNKSFLDQTHLGLAIKEHGLFFDRNGAELPPNQMRSEADSLYLSIRADDGVVGWECTGSNKILDLAARPGTYRPKEFAFKPVVAEEGEIVLLPRNFYILTTDEFIKVPPNCSAELRATDVRVGEFRSHFAGFIDAGWGCGKDLTNRGQPITLEVVISERVPFSLRHRQFVAKIRYERMSEVTDTLYDAANSNYTGQVTAKLSKLFAS